jgi:hypothetical protein
MTAIALKTRSPVLSATAFIPLVGPAYLAHTLRSDHRPENMIDRVRKDSESASIKHDLPTFKHGLLRYDWAPELHVGDKDIDMFKEGAFKFTGVFELLWTADVLEKRRKAEAKAKRKKADKEARDKDRRRKVDKRDERKELKRAKERKVADRRERR